MASKTSNGIDPNPENVVQTALESAAVKPIIVTDAATYAVVPIDRKVVKLPAYMEKPSRKMAKVLLLNVDDFIAYVNEQKTHATRMFAQRGGSVTIEAVIDYHAPMAATAQQLSAEVKGLPDWGMHRATLKMDVSEEFQPWVTRAGQYMHQLEFAQFIDDNAASMYRPDPAAMSELALNLQGTEDAVFKSQLDPHNGNGVFTYERTATPKGTIEIPRVIDLFVPIIEGTKASNVQIKLQWRIQDGRPHFAWRIPALSQMLRKAMLVQIDVIKDETELPVWIGSVAGMQQPETLPER